jgi:sporulation protein YunB
LPYFEHFLRKSAEKDPQSVPVFNRNSYIIHMTGGVTAMRRLSRAPVLRSFAFAPRGRVGRPGMGRSPGKLLLRLLAASVAVTAVCLLLNARAKPHIRALAETAAKQQVSSAVTEAVETVLLREKISYETLVTLRVSGGGIESIETNTREVNLLKAKINEAVESAVAQRKARLKLPLGALMGVDLLAGWGPKIGVSLAMTGHALSTVKSDLVSSGVNQTMHRILMPLHVSISVILPGGVSTVEIETTVCLAETVIVGSVPQGLISSQR